MRPSEQRKTCPYNALHNTTSYYSKHCLGADETVFDIAIYNVVAFEGEANQNVNACDASKVHDITTENTADFVEDPPAAEVRYDYEWEFKDGSDQV